jgi:hypothetical protein
MSWCRWTLQASGFRLQASGFRLQAEGRLRCALGLCQRLRPSIGHTGWPHAPVSSALPRPWSRSRRGAVPCRGRYAQPPSFRPRRCLDPEPHARLLVNPECLLGLDLPALAPERHARAPTDPTRAGLANLPDPLVQRDLPEPIRETRRILIRTLAPVRDQPVAIGVSDLRLAPGCASGSQGVPPWLAAGWFPWRAHIGYMRVNRVTDCVPAGDARSVGRQPRIDQGLGPDKRPALGAFATWGRLACVSHPFA